MAQYLSWWGSATPALALLPASAQGAGRPAPAGGGHIAYVGADGNLYVAQPDGMGRRALTTDGAAAPYTQPAWSPAGSGILALRFATSLTSSLSSPTSGLWLVWPSGGARQLTANVPRGFAWAPDGHTVVYEEGFPPDQTTLVQLDIRSGRKRTVPCDGSFRLIGVAGVTGAGNRAGGAQGLSDRAIGIQGDQIEAVSLADGAAQALTHYPTRAGVWQNLAQVTPSGRTLVYTVAPGTRVVILDLRSGRSLTVRIASAITGLAASADLRWIAYSAGEPGGIPQSTLVRVNKSGAALRSASYVTPQAFAPNSSALVFTSQLDGPPAVFVAPTGCPAQCARRLDAGHDPAWGP